MVKEIADKAWSWFTLFYLGIVILFYLVVRINFSELVGGVYSDIAGIVAVGYLLDKSNAAPVDTGPEPTPTLFHVLLGIGFLGALIAFMGGKAASVIGVPTLAVATTPFLGALMVAGVAPLENRLTTLISFTLARFTGNFILGAFISAIFMSVLHMSVYAGQQIAFVSAFIFFLFISLLHMFSGSPFPGDFGHFGWNWLVTRGFAVALPW